MAFRALTKAAQLASNESPLKSTSCRSLAAALETSLGVALGSSSQRQFATEASPAAEQSAGQQLWNQGLWIPALTAAAAAALVSGATGDGGTNAEQAAADAPPQSDPPRQPTVIFVLGGPGSGKGTQSAKLVSEYGFVHLSAGDLLRAEIKSGSENGTMISNMIKEGKIVPSEVTVGLLRAAMAKSGKSKFLIDGFPRNEENRSAFERVTGIQPDFVLFFDCPEEVMTKRLLARNEGRTDDNVETIRKRFRVYVEQTMPIVDYYESLGRVKRVAATKSPEQVFTCIKPFFKQYLETDVLEANQALLHAIDSGDYAAYSKLCEPDITAFEPEAQGHVVEGLSFHRFYFQAAAQIRDLSPAPTLVQSTISAPLVTFLGDNAAVLTYVRLQQVAGSPKQGFTSTYQETRVWVRKREGNEWVWKNVHFHRSSCPSL